MSIIEKDKTFCENNCGLFDFMANTLGIKVLHPGGYIATNSLCSMISISKDSNVLDLACGSRTTSIYLNNKYKCRVIGVDISENLINIAQKEVSRAGLDEQVQFKVADALELPFPDNSFDLVIAQAFFILINDKEKAIKEICRVLKPEGYLGSLELSWFKTPTEIAYNELLNKTCNDFIPRTRLFEEWESFYKSYELQRINTKKNPMTSGMMDMMKTEGFANFTQIVFKMIFNSRIRKRMMDVQRTFSKYNDYLGYGIYCYRK